MPVSVPPDAQARIGVRPRNRWPAIVGSPSETVVSESLRAAALAAPAATKELSRPTMRVAIRAVVRTRVRVIVNAG
jgi:hypothetical protein